MPSNESHPSRLRAVGCQALTATLDGKAALVIPREHMRDLMVWIGIALREVPPSQTEAKERRGHVPSGGATLPITNARQHPKKVITWNASRLCL